MKTLEFFVPGIPAPGGSKKAFWNPKANRVVVMDDCKRNKPRRECVRWSAIEAVRSAPIPFEVPLLGPVYLDVIFMMPRPKSHFRTGKHSNELRPDAPFWHTLKPDRTKLLRALEDALTDAGIWRDDTQVVCGFVHKKYSTRPGALISIREAEEEGRAEGKDRPA